MTEYKKKKKLIDDNQDIYISEYDKNLSYNALSGIIDAKKEYANAAKSNNKELMTAANSKANSIRAQYGSYTGGEFGDKYIPLSASGYKAGSYSSKYEDDLDRLYDSLMEPEPEFNYNYEKDPVYQAYKSVYDTKGKNAYDRALAENAIRTGGMTSSNAQSAAMQAMNYYNSQLAAIIPELYEAAYERYYTGNKDKYNRLSDVYKTIADREERDYKRFLDSEKQKTDERDFFTELAENERDRIYKKKTDLEKALFDYESEREKKEYEQKEKRAELIYDIMRDMAKDEMWRNEYNLDSRKIYAPAYSGNIGSGNILTYARQLFSNPDLTMEDVYNLLGL